VKTISLKKVAVIAVASLAIGGISSVPANAAVGSPTLPIYLDAATSTVATVDFVTAKAAGNATYTAGLITGSMTAITTKTSEAVELSVGAAGSAFGTNDLFDLSLNGTVVATAVGDAAITSNNLTYTPAKAGTYAANIRVYITGTTRVAAVQTVDIPFTWTVTALPGYSNSLSTGFITYGNGNTTPSSSTSALQNVVSATASTSNRATISAVIKDTTGADYASGASLSAEISGPGYLKWANQAITATQCDVSPTYGANVGRSLAARAVDAQSVVYVCADGTAGTSTVTVKITDADSVTTTLATRTVVFTGNVTKITATGVMTNARSGGANVLGDNTANRVAGTALQAIIVQATDSAGNGVSGLNFTALSSAPAVMQSTISCNEDVKSTANTLSSGGVGFYNCSVTSAATSASGNTATLTVRTVDPVDATKFLTSDVKFTLASTATTGSEVLSFDKLTYAPGEAMIITRTGKDSSGNPVHDGATSPAVTFNKGVGGTAPAAGTYVKGTSASSTSAATATVFAPVTPGPFIATATAANGATITATATVTDANAAVLTQIDALNAKIVALNALIAKIMKRLGVK